MEDQREKLNQYMADRHANAIIDGEKEYREDSYYNLLTKAGTTQDSSTAWRFKPESFTDDMELIQLYEGNGLFAKIIDRPAEESVKHGLDIDFGSEAISEYVDKRLDELDFEDTMATAEKWSRLYGGSIVVMIADDGRGLEEPLDRKNVKRIEELHVFERSIVQADESNMYTYNYKDTLRRAAPFGQPEFYYVTSLYGTFWVHYTRCLVFRNGRMPSQTTNSLYRYWGIPEYERIKEALRECITTHKDGPKLLERSIQAIYKMRNLANLLATDEGEDKVLRRLQVIDMSRGILNSMAIDAEGEDYDFRSMPLTGVKEIVDSACNMLSAVTDIPQTILFGRSPAGENSTGKADFENYYNMVERIQKRNLKKNVRTLLDLVLRQGVLDGEIDQIPDYKVKFKSLWSLTEQEQLDADLKKEQIASAKATTMKTYVDMQVLDPTEIRNAMAKDGDFGIDEVVSGGEDELEIPDGALESEEGQEPEGGNASQLAEAALNAVQGNTGEMEEPVEEATDETDKSARLASWALTAAKAEHDEEPERQADADDESASMGEDMNVGVGVLVVKDGYILCGQRDGSGLWCGPGGHIKVGEDPKQAAMREAQEEFGIKPLNLIPMGDYEAESEDYEDSRQYICTECEGELFPNDHEMFNLGWHTPQEIEDRDLFPPFKYALEMLTDLLNKSGSRVNMDGGNSGGNPNHAKDGKFASAPEGGSKETGKKPENERKDYQAARLYTKSVKGTVAENGVTVKSVSSHAGYKMKHCGISENDLVLDLTEPDATYPGNKKHPDATCFQRGTDRIVMSPDGVIITTIDLVGDEDD